MRIIGFCTECHRVRQVRVSGHGLAMGAAHGTYQGVCSECEDLAENTRSAQYATRGIRPGQTVKVARWHAPDVDGVFRGLDGPVVIVDTGDHRVERIPWKTVKRVARAEAA